MKPLLKDILQNLLKRSFSIDLRTDSKQHFQLKDPANHPTPPKLISILFQEMCYFVLRICRDYLKL